MSKTRELSVEEAIEKCLRHYKLEKRVRERKVLKLWDRVVGESIASHTRAYRVQKGKLWVRVDSSSWLNELLFFKEKIKEKINQELGKGVIREVYFRMGRVEKRPPPPPPPPPKKKRRLTPEKREKIEEMVRKLKDKRLRETFRKILITLR